MKGLKPTELLPLFGFTGEKTYKVGHLSVRLRLDPARVFPPSETSLALAEALLGYPGLSTLDLGTGSGLLGIVAAKNGAGNVTAVDVDPLAVQQARENARLNQVEGQMDFRVFDVLTDDLESTYDLIITNPPFMPMLAGATFMSAEITRAVCGGPRGTDMLLRFAGRSREWLSSGGVLLFPVPEFGDHQAVEGFLADRYWVRLVARRPIRFWLAEYDPQFAAHAKSIAKDGVAAVWEGAEHLMSMLSIFECRPRGARHERRQAA